MLAVEIQFGWIIFAVVIRPLLFQSLQAVASGIDPIVIVVFMTFNKFFVWMPGECFTASTTTDVRDFGVTHN
jgi:hypothetical protein